MRLNQQYVLVTEAPKLFPHRPHINTVRRWIYDGIDGVRLETFKIGGRSYTSVEAIERFISTRSGQPHDKPAKGKTPGHAAAEAKLDALGVR